MRMDEMRSGRRRCVEVVPLIALPAGVSQRFTYRLPPGVSPSAGSLVSVPFGSRVVRGVVWARAGARAGAGRARRGIKAVREVVGAPLLFPGEACWLEALAALSLESLAQLTKALVSVRAPLPGGVPPSRAERSPGGATTHVHWSDDIGAVLALGAAAQVLVLAPDRAVARRAARLCATAGVPARVFSQSLRVTERRRILQGLIAGEPGATIATHSGVFLPGANLAAIIVAEASLPSHRQWDLHPRYDARVAAVLRGAMFSVPVHLTSHLPSLDLASLADRGAFVHGALSPLTARVLRRPVGQAHPLLPEVEGVMRETLAQSRPVFLFHDVVGSERQYACDACGHRLACARCGGAVQRDGRTLVCRACGSRAGPPPLFCPRCDSPSIRPRRVGTRALEEIVRRVFPGVPTIRLDREAVSRASPLRAAVRGPSLVIGTEKALSVLPDEPSFGTSVVVDADTLLSRPDVDAAEAALRLIARVARLTAPPAGRTVLVQTAMPYFPLFRALADGQLPRWLEGEREDRERLGAPPYAALFRLTKSFPSLPRAREGTERLARRFSSRRVLVGRRVFRTGRATVGELVLRGPRERLWRLLPDVPRSWTTDPHIPLREVVGSRPRFPSF